MTFNVGLLLAFKGGHAWIHTTDMQTCARLGSERIDEKVVSWCLVKVWRAAGGEEQCQCVAGPSAAKLPPPRHNHIKCCTAPPARGSAYTNTALQCSRAGTYYQILLSLSKHQHGQTATLSTSTVNTCTDEIMHGHEVQNHKTRLLIDT